MISPHPRRPSVSHRPRPNLFNRFRFHHLALPAILLLVAVCVSVAPRGALSAKSVESAALRQPVSSSLQQPAPKNLQGQQAVDYLKEQGIYDRLSASIEASSYEVERTQHSGLSRTLAGRDRPECCVRPTARRI